MSIGTVASITPVMPANTKFTRPPMQNSIGVVSRSLPPQRVPSQANTFTPVGTAISIVVAMNRSRIHWATPLGNMWCTQTISPRPTMMKDATAT